MHEQNHKFFKIQNASVVYVILNNVSYLMYLFCMLFNVLVFLVLPVVILPLDYPESFGNLQISPLNNWHLLPDY